MTVKEYKRVARILKAAYKATEEKARKNGVDLGSKEYEALIDKVRETVLREMGFSLSEYRKVKAKQDPKYEYEVDEAEALERSGLPFEAEMKEVAKAVAKEVIPPPRTINKIYKYDDNYLKEGLMELSERLDQTVTDEDLKERIEQLKTEILTWNSENFSENFKKNIDILGMPDFRKLAMGLQAQIDALGGGDGDVTGPASSTDNAVVRFDGTTGKTIQNSAVTIDDSGNVAGLGTLASGSGTLTIDETASLSSYLQDVVDDTTPTLGGNLDANGNNITSMGDITFQTGVTGGTLSTGTSNADKFVLRAYDVDNTTYRTLIEADAGNTVVLQIIGDYLAIEDATDTTKHAEWDLSGATASTATTLTFVQTAARTITFPDATGTLALVTGTSDAITVGTIELGHASDTTLSRASAGVLAVEGVNVLTVAGGTLTGNINLGEGADPADRGIVIDSSLSADERYSGITIPGTAGATLAFGDICYLDVTAGEWLLADASAASTSGSVPIGICVDASTDGNATSMLLIGTVRSATFPASIALGAALYISETAGDITATAPTTTDSVVRPVGWAVTTEPNTIYFNPSADYQTNV